MIIIEIYLHKKEWDIITEPFLPSSTIKKISKSNAELTLLSGADSRKFMTIFGHNMINLSRTLYYLKRTMGNDYENSFLSSNKNKKLDMKKSGEILDKYFNLHKQLNEDETDMVNNSNNNNNNNNVILENKIDEENYSTNKSNNNKKIIIEKSYLNNEYNKSHEMNNNNINNINNSKSKKKSKKVVKKSKSKSKNKKKK